MSLNFLPTQPAEQADLLEYLVSCFGARPDAPIANPELMRWKYFQPRLDWSGPRSYVLKQEERIVAHVGFFPLTFLLASGEVAGVHPMDWVTSLRGAGVGARLMRELAALAEVLLTTGGSLKAQKALPKAGFQPYGSLDLFARVARPWSQIRSLPSKRWRTPLKLARNTVWSRTPLAPAGEWWALPVSRLDAGTLPASLNRTSDAVTPLKRSPPMFEYMLACPGVVFSASLLLEGKKTRGYFVLSRVGLQTRIADLFLDSDRPADWRAAFSVASRTAAEDRSTCELMAGASTQLTRDAILANGFRLRRHDPIFIYDPKSLLTSAPPVNLNLLDGDEFYMQDPAHPYLT